MFLALTYRVLVRERNQDRGVRGVTASATKLTVPPLREDVQDTLALRGVFFDVRHCKGWRRLGDSLSRPLPLLVG